MKRRFGTSSPARARRGDAQSQRSRPGGGYALGAMAIGLAALVGMAAMSTVGLTPWKAADTGEVGVGRRVDPSTTIAGEPAEEAGDEITMPAHLMPTTPGYLGEPGSAEPKEESTEEPPATSPASSRRAAPASQASAAPAPTTTTTTAPGTTTTVAPAPTTTAPPTTTTTLPPKVTIPDGSPQAVGDSYLLAPDTIEHLTVLDNDSDPDGDVSGLTLSLVSGPAHARRFTLAGDYFRYRSYAESNSQFSATDSFVYEICDADGNCDTATVTVLIDVG